MIIMITSNGQLRPHLQVSILVDAEAQLDHAVDAGAEGVGLVQGEAGDEQRLLEQQQHQVLDGPVALVGVRALPDLLQQGSGVSLMYTQRSQAEVINCKLDVADQGSIRRSWTHRR